ncbi:hypothetical protein DMP23_32595 [Amycolatopsis sp. A1MSW2902]
MVWFCLEQTISIDGAKYKVVRVDTEHGTVHVHKFTKSDQTGTRKTLQTIPREGHDVVDTHFSEWLDRLLNEWEANVRRFRDAD